jgi:hypothetical protein
MSKATLSRRTERGWEVIRRLEDETTISQPITATKPLPAFYPAKPRFNPFYLLAVILTAGIFISAIFLLRAGGKGINGRLVMTAPAPVVGVIKHDSVQHFYMQNGQTFAITDSGISQNPELNFQLLDDESLVWISFDSTHFITARQNKLIVYKLGENEQVIKLTELNSFQPPSDDSGIMVGGQEILSADLTRHEKIIADDQLVNGTCKLNLCAVNGQQRVYLKRTEETLWSAVSPSQNAQEGGHRPNSYIVNGNTVLIAGEDSFDLFEQNNGQWSKTKQWKKDLYNFDEAVEVVWIGQSSPISEPVILMKYVNSGAYLFVELGTGKCETLSGVKTSLSKIIWIKNDSLNFFDRDGNLYQYEIKSKEETK